MTTKTVDARGRLTLGPRYANRLVIVRENEDGALEVIPAEAIPVREAWLYRNAKARDAVRAGIEEARAGRFAEAPAAGRVNAETAEIAEKTGKGKIGEKKKKGRRRR